MQEGNTLRHSLCGFPSLYFPIVRPGRTLPSLPREAVPRLQTGKDKSKSQVLLFRSPEALGGGDLKRGSKKHKRRKSPLNKEIASRERVGASQVTLGQG